MGWVVLKTEPSEYCFGDLSREGRTRWDGVTNAAALGHLRKLRAGDTALIYHTGDERRIAGLAKIVTDPYEDPSNPGATKAGEPKFAVVDVEAQAPATRRASLDDIKADVRFAESPLVRIGRLSVVPLEPVLGRALAKMAGV